MLVWALSIVGVTIVAVTARENSLWWFLMSLTILLLLVLFLRANAVSELFDSVVFNSLTLRRVKVAILFINGQFKGRFKRLKPIMRLLAERRGESTVLVHDEHVHDWKVRQALPSGEKIYYEVFDILQLRDDIPPALVDEFMAAGAQFQSESTDEFYGRKMQKHLDLATPLIRLEQPLVSSRTLFALALIHASKHTIIELQVIQAAKLAAVSTSSIVD